MEHIINRLNEIGVDTDSVIARLGENEQLYISICIKFIKDPNYQLFQDALLLRDWDAAEEYIHTLKGVAVNLGFIRLQLLCRTLYDKITNGESLFLKETLIAFSEEYDRIITILKAE